MKVVICGGGQVGYNLAAYLSRENNDITVIDPDPENIARINDHLDANGIIGFGAHPGTLKEAGLAEADMIVAVSDIDEVNMVACQVAHSLFGVPKKIARIQAGGYLDPSWSNLFARAHMPIDVIISPEREVAEAVMQRVKVPGTSDIIPLLEDQLLLIGVHCENDCPIINTPIFQIKRLFPDLDLEILAIVRGKERIIAQDENQLLIGDEVYFLVSKAHLYRALSLFGHEEPEARHIIILGGGNIGKSLALRIKEDIRGADVKIIELNKERARKLSEELPNVIVLNGDGLNKEILEEANVENTEIVISVSDSDENNILACLLAKQYGCQRTMALINKDIYTDLTGDMGIDAVISPRSITVSKMLRHIRRGRIKGIYNIYDGFAEVMVSEVSQNCQILDQTVGDLDLGEDVKVGCVVKNGEILLPHKDLVFKARDIVISVAKQESVVKLEKLFSSQLTLSNL